jgi:hypothetical protein
MVSIKRKLVISIVITITVMTMGYVSLATETQPVGREFEVVSEGFEMLEMCPMDAPRTLPEAARTAKEKNKIGAQIICEDLPEFDDNPAMAMFMRYASIHVSCMPHGEMFLYHAQLTGLWTCMKGGTEKLEPGE